MEETVYITDLDHQVLFLRHCALEHKIKPVEGEESSFKIDSNYKKLIRSKKSFVPLMVPNYGKFEIEFNESIIHLHIKPSCENEPSQTIPDSRQTPLSTLVIRNDVFLKYCPSIKDEVSELIMKAVTSDKKENEESLLIKFNRMDFWTTLAELDEVQTMEQIFLPRGMKEDIMNSIDSFKKSKPKYNRYGRPYKKTFLLEGKAGMGKSSIAKSVADHLGCTLYILNLGCKELSEGNLVNLFTHIDKDSVLLIEDVDSFFEGRKMGDTPSKISFSTILNILDGAFTTGNGLITFITANHAEKMDKALIRPGRIDKIIHFGEMTREQFDDACSDLIPDEPIDDELFKICNRGHLSMSALMDILFHGESPEHRRTLAKACSSERTFNESGASMYC